MSSSVVDSTGSGAAAEHIPAAAVEYGYPHGHIGHLTAEEEQALREFKKLVTDKGLYKAGPPPSHDDHTLLRFLRARRWVPQDALKQFHDTETWRAATHLHLLYDTIDLDAYEQARRLYPQWTGRRDRRGIPLYVFAIRGLDSRTVAAYEKAAASARDSKAPNDTSTPGKLLRLFALYENLTRFAQPLCTELPDREWAAVTPITLSTNIVDVSGVGLKQFWNLKSHMQAASQLATAHYPETLDRIFIIGAPFFFTTVWGWIKRWFDPITVSKIFVLAAHEVKPVLDAFIDPANIPRQYGGELDFEWGQMPNLDPAIRDRVRWEKQETKTNGDGTTRSDFPPGPVYWRPAPEDPECTLECVAVGSVGGIERSERVCTIPRVFRGEAFHSEKEEAYKSEEGEEEEADGLEAPKKDKQVGGDQGQESEEEGGNETVLNGRTSGTDADADADAEEEEEGGSSSSSIADGVQGVQNLSLAGEKSEVRGEADAPEQMVAQTVGA